MLTRAVDGFVYVERTEQSGRVRQGLVGMVDLEAYSYRAGAKCAVRPSESTVESRIPPRMKVRTGAALETPHIMMLADDPGCTLIEPIAAHKERAAQSVRGRTDAGRRPHCRLGRGGPCPDRQIETHWLRWAVRRPLMPNTRMPPAATR